MEHLQVGQSKKVADGIIARRFKTKTSYSAYIHGKRETFDTLEAAQVARKDAYTSHDPFAGNPLLSDHLDTWLEKSKAKKSSKKRYASSIKHIKNRLGDLRLSELSPVIIQTYINELEKKPASQAAVLAVLKSACKKAVFKQKLDSNPCDSVEKSPNANKPAYRRALPDGVDYDRKKHVLTPDHVQEVLTIVAGSDVELGCKTLYTSALRVGELCSLQGQSLDLISQSIWIDNTVDAEGNVTEAKTENSIGAVNITNDLIHELAAQVVQPDHFIFNDGDPTKPLKPSVFASRLAKALKGTRYAGLRPHCLRHASGSALLAAGVIPVKVAAHLRDSLEVFSKVYAHFLNEKVTADELERALNVESNILLSDAA